MYYDEDLCDACLMSLLDVDEDLIVEEFVPFSLPRRSLLEGCDIMEDEDYLYVRDYRLP